MKHVTFSPYTSALLGMLSGIAAMGLIFTAVSSVLAAPTQAPPNGNPSFPLQGPRGPQGPAGPAGPTGPQGPAGPSGSAGPTQTMILNGGSSTSTWYCTSINVQSTCGDADGCRIRMIMDHKTDGNDQVRMIDQNIAMENYSLFTGNGVYGWTRQGGGGDYSWISGNGLHTVAAPWDWAWIFTYNHANCYGSHSALSAYNLGLMSHPHVRTTFLIYD